METNGNAVDRPVVVVVWKLSCQSSGKNLYSDTFCQDSIQGSGIGPVAYTVTAADLKPLHSGNSLVKFTDDTYLLLSNHPTPAHASRRWTTQPHGRQRTNLELNVSKSKHFVFQDSRRRTAVTALQLLPDVSRENVLNILGVTIRSHQSASGHIRRVIDDSAQSLYALRLLRHHDITEIGLHSVSRAVVVSRLT